MLAQGMVGVEGYLATPTLVFARANGETLLRPFVEVRCGRHLFVHALVHAVLAAAVYTSSTTHPHVQKHNLHRRKRLQK